MAYKPPKNLKQTGKTITPVGINQYSAVDYSAPDSSPVPTYGAPSTHDAQYNQSLSLAGLSRDQSFAALAGDAARLRLNYGYLDDAHTVDPNNPFGRAQLMKKNYDQTTAGTTNSYAARGQQTSGAFNRMQGANLFNYQQQDDASQKAFDAARADQINQAAAVNNEYGTAGINAEGDALQRAIANRSAYQTTPAAASSSDRLLSSTKRKDGKTVNRYASGRVAVF